MTAKITLALIPPHTEAQRIIRGKNIHTFFLYYYIIIGINIDIKSFAKEFKMNIQKVWHYGSSSQVHVVTEGRFQ
jgi:hypothetical protein